MENENSMIELFCSVKKNDNNYYIKINDRNFPLGARSDKVAMENYSRSYKTKKSTHETISKFVMSQLKKAQSTSDKIHIYLNFKEGMTYDEAYDEVFKKMASVVVLYRIGQDQSLDSLDNWQATHMVFFNLE